MQQNTNHPIKFKGDGNHFFGIWIVNILLSIITLGIYSAWATVRTKRYFYGNTYLAGDNFEYHAQPMQILKGRLVAFFAFFVWAIANSFFPVVSIVLLLFFAIALPFILWSNARFDAAMTSYRNVHFSFVASLKQAYKVMLGRGIGALVIISLYSFLVATAATESVLLAVVLGLFSVIVLAIIYAWIAAGLHKYFSNGFQYGEWRFNADIGTGFFVKIYLKVMAFTILTIITSIALAYLALSMNSHSLQPNDILPLMSEFSFVTFAIIYVFSIAFTIAATAYTTTRIRNYIYSHLVVSAQENDNVQYKFNSNMTARGYARLIISNFLLQVISLGIARPWVMVRTARYTADHTTVNGDMSLLKANDKASQVKSAVSDEVAQVFDVGFDIS